MHGIEILVQNSKQILNVIVKTEPHVIDLKGPVNKGFNQSSFVARRCKAYTATLFLNKTIAHNVVKAAYKFIRTHKKKLKNLTRNSVLPFTLSEVVTDLSSFCSHCRAVGCAQIWADTLNMPTSINKTTPSRAMNCLVKVRIIRNLKDSKDTGK